MMVLRLNSMLSPPRCLARRSLSWALLVFALLLTAARPASAADPQGRPNVVMLFADDWGRYASSYAKLAPGGPSDLIQTPNFDRIAKEGVLFTRAFVNAPSCTPCRSSLLSGQYFWRTGRGAILRNAIWDESIPTYPLLLEQAGYKLGFTYKVWSPGKPIDAPYGGARNAFMERGRRFNTFSQNVDRADDISAGKQELLDEVRGNFQDFLQTVPADRPYCYWFGPTNTHRRWVKGSGKKHWGLNPDQLQGKLPKAFPDVPEVREDFADYLGEVQAFDAGVGVILDELEKRGELDHTLILISGDHGIPGMPHGKCNLYDCGAAVPLAVRWPKKIPGGRVLDDFVCLPDLCPTILEAAGLAPPEVMTGRSLMPVLSVNESGQVDATRDHALIGRERHVDKARAGNLPYPMRAIRTGDFLYIRNFESDRWPMGDAPGYGGPPGTFPNLGLLNRETYAAFPDMDASPTKSWLIQHRADPRYKRYFDLAFERRPAEELYDLKSDPDQVNNVAGQPEFAAVQEQLAQRLLGLLKETNDPRVTADPVPFEHPPFTEVEDR